MNKTALRLIGVGFFIVGAILAGLFVGRWLDEVFGTSPLLLLIGLLLGVIGAFYGVYRLVLPLMDDKKRRGN